MIAKGEFMTSRTIKNLKNIIIDGTLLISKNGNETKIQRFRNNVIKINNEMISWKQLQDIITNGAFHLKIENNKLYFSKKGGVRPGAGAKIKEKKHKTQSFSLSPGAITYLDYLVFNKRISKSKIIENIIRKHAELNGLPII